MRTVEISVTAKDITEGDAEECTSCPIALAAARKFPDRRVRVYPLSIVLAAIGTYSRYMLPAEAIRFVDDFDNGHSVQPFTFQLEVPEVDE